MYHQGHFLKGFKTCREKTNKDRREKAQGQEMVEEQEKVETPAAGQEVKQVGSGGSVE